MFHLNVHLHTRRGHQNTSQTVVSHHVVRELSSGPLQEQPVLLTTELSLKSEILFKYIGISWIHSFICFTQHKETSKVSEQSQKHRYTGSPQLPDELFPGTGRRCHQTSLVLITGPSTASPRAPLRPVHPEDGTEHAQEQGQLHKHQDTEVGAAQKRPVSHIVTITSLPRRGRSCHAQCGCL